MFFLRKEFWTDYFWFTDPWGERVYPEFREPIRLPLTEKSGLQLELDEDCFEYISLCLYHPDLEEPIVSLPIIPNARKFRFCYCTVLP